MGIVCDICWNVLGKVRNLNECHDLHNIGRWEICSECVKRYDEQIFTEVRDKKYKRN